VLAIGQVAISLLLLVTAALFVRNLAQANIVHPGFDTEHTVVSQIAFVQDRYSREARDAMLQAALERVRALPGVTGAALTTGVPLTLRSGRTTGTNITIDGSPKEINVYFHSSDVGPDYFATMGMRVEHGRAFALTDAPNATRVAVVNQEFVRRFFDGKDPTGHTMTLPGGPDPIPTEIVGVVSNSKHRTLGESPMPAIYTPMLQRHRNRSVVFIVARVAGNTSDVIGPMQRAVSQIDASTAVDTRSMRSAVAFAFMPSRIGAILVGSLGVLGLVLAMIGLFGMISFAASRRVREIAIRMSLGASRPNVIGLVLREALAVSGIGMALGMIAATAVSRPISAFLVDGLSALDPLSYAATGAVLGVVAVAAGWIPAWRASRIDPMVVLRRDG
jgi:predicted permease